MEENIYNINLLKEHLKQEKATCSYHDAYRLNILVHMETWP